jgi:hypothetical protein
MFKVKSAPVGQEFMLKTRSFEATVDMVNKMGKNKK